MLFQKKNKILDELGFYIDQDGILNRLWRENGGWNSHLDNTKKFILQSVDKIQRKGKVAVLGSGWLLDVPIKELSENFSEVVLFDIIHPREIKAKMQRYKNIKCVETDLTGGYIQLVSDLCRDIRKNGKQPLINQQVPVCNFNAFDMVISVNILNQLDIILTEYLMRFGLYTTSELNVLRQRIQQQHINALPLTKTCLITDYEEIQHTDTGEIFTKNLLWITLPEGKDRTIWQWNFDTTKTYYEDRNTILNVVAMNF